VDSAGWHWAARQTRACRVAAGAVVVFVGIKPGDEDVIVGQPIGRHGIYAELEAEMIPYSPEELVSLGEREYEWCEKEAIKASQEMGFGKEWLQALEHVKNTTYVDPGEQTKMVHELAAEAVEYVTKHDMVSTVKGMFAWEIANFAPFR
jgi:hypothetical protein